MADASQGIRTLRWCLRKPESDFLFRCLLGLPDNIFGCQLLHLS
jgi:hypothetical protein